MELADRAVIVTGGTGALGSAVCEALLARGATVHVTYVLDREVGHFEQRMTAHKGRYSLYRADITKEADVTALFAEVKGTAGRVDAVLNIAGGFAMGPIETTPIATFEMQVALNLRSVFLCAREAVRHMKPQGRGLDTPANRASMPDADHGKWVKPEEIAAVIAFLCGDGSKVVSGAAVPVYGDA
jgi:NAD(P)-dependent dehydrogenase (short-subunit alcohol dehydrogenase family)